MSAFKRNPRSFFAALILTLLGTRIAYAADLSMQDYIDDANWRSTRIDMQIDLTASPPQYKGRLVATLEGEASDAAYLIMNSREPSFRMTSLKVSRTDGAALPSNEVELEFMAPGDEKSTMSAVRFAEPLPKGTQLAFDFTYEFVKEQGQVLKNEGLAYASWVTAWYPTTIASEDGLISQHSLSLPGEIEFTLPKGWSALSNGKRIKNKVQNGKSVQTWRTDNPISWSYVAADYDVSSVKVGDIDIAIYALTVDQKQAKKNSLTYAEIIDILQQNFGPYPYDTFALAEIPDGVTDYFGASSEQGFIVSITPIFASEDATALFSHEAAHSWWGNLVGCYGPGEPVCSEAAAQMGPLLVMDQLRGKDTVKHMLDISVPGFTAYASARGYFAMIRSGIDTPLGEMESGNPTLHLLMDSKGMWFWHMLRLEVGDDAFFATIKEVTAEGKSMPLRKLTKRFADKSGRDLSTFLDQWLNRTGAPVIDMAWKNKMPIVHNKHANRDMEQIIMSLGPVYGTTTVTFTQEQPDLYALNVPVRFNFYDGSSETKTLKLTDRSQSFSFDFEKSIKSIDMDPDLTILMWRPAYGPKPTFD